MRRFVADHLAFAQKNARWIGGGFLLTLSSSFGQTFFIGLSGNDIRATFNLSGGEFGGLYMLATLASALTLPWLGRTLDLMAGWKVVRFTMPLLAAACILMAVAPGVILLGVSLYMLRLFGQGMMTEIAITETGRWFVASRGKAMALITPGLMLGNGLFPVVFVLIHGAFGWHDAWLASAALVLLIGWPAVMALLRVERVPHASEAGHKSARVARDWTRSQVVRDPVLYLLLAGTLAPPFIGTVIFFHQGYLISLRHYDPLAFAGAFPVMAVTTVVFGFVCGHLVDRFGALKLLPFFLAPLTLASLAVGLVTPVWGVYLFMLLLGVSNGFTQNLMGALWPEVYGLANLGGIRAITVSAMVLSTALGPGITGSLIDWGVPLPTQMLWMAGWCVVASLALGFAANKVRVREADRRDLSQHI
ncbi:MFS transporter [Porphyrobacter algicida]|uniref:MFS transporter n=1 Tax=Qipengyuania algicida TaxID=1836209 RepID=A0A845AH53_9SPHN|nr:MFS transporter [Qipengyuania algicida]MXP28271.1 MFS transporter [Qipengyuania algicida]